MPSCRVDWSTAFRLLSQAFTSKLPAKLANPSSTGVTPPSKAHLRYTPAPTTGTSSSLSVPQSTPSAPPNHSMSGNAGPQNQPGGNANNAPVDYFWIVFGIKDIDGFDEIENIETTTQLKDPSFFEDLKSRHKRHRWFFQDWFSPYRFRFCRFVQVRTSTHGLPGPTDYSSLRKLSKRTFHALGKPSRTTMVIRTITNTIRGLPL